MLINFKIIRSFQIMDIKIINISFAKLSTTLRPIAPVNKYINRNLSKCNNLGASKFRIVFHHNKLFKKI